MATIGNFFDAIYGPTTGWVRIARRDASTGSFQESFFQWPQDKSSIVNLCLASAPSHDVFYSPALFNSDESSKKENVKSANVAWCDFDGNIPTELGDVPEPSLRIYSSDSDHQHWYWILDGPKSPSEIEGINRKLVAALSADTVWDAGRLLRPPGTYNHKRKVRTSLKDFLDNVYSTESFGRLPEPKHVEILEKGLPEDLRKFEDVVALNNITTSTWKLIKDGRPKGFRSEGLYQVAVKCAESGVSAVDILSILYFCDNRWGKFKGRTDQGIRLWQIAQKAKARHPDEEDVEISEDLFFMSPLDLINSDIAMEWVWQDLLESQGLMVFSGQSGVGKTQFSLQTAIQFILSGNLLERQTIHHGKLGFLSLEMGPPELKTFLKKQLSAYNAEQQDIINKHLVVFPLGEPLFLDLDAGKRILKMEIERHELTGLFIDSLGQTTTSGLSDDDSMRNLFNWLQIVRKNLKLFIWMIHHNRKASDGNKKPSKLSDVYGSQYITSMASSVICLWPSDRNKAIEFISLKVRMAEKPRTMYIARNEFLQFQFASDIAETDGLELQLAKDTATSKLSPGGQGWLTTPNMEK